VFESKRVGVWIVNRKQAFLVAIDPLLSVVVAAVLTACALAVLAWVGVFFLQLGSWMDGSALDPHFTLILRVGYAVICIVLVAWLVCRYREARKEPAEDEQGFESN
jgi:type VI protein secretion system component VasK